MNEETLPYNPNNPNLSPHKSALRMGILIAVMLIIYTMILYIGGQSTNKYMGWISYALMMIGMWLAVKNYRDTLLGGYISYGQAYLMSFLTALYCAILYGVFSYLYFKFLARDSMQEMIHLAEQELLNNKNISEEQATQAMDMYKKYIFIPFTLAFGSLISFTLLGALLSLFVASFTQRKNMEAPHA